jgi:hypothetical protein
VALAAVYAAILHNERFAIIDAYGLRGANLHAPRAADTVAIVNLQGVVKHGLKKIKVKQS